ncbi:hypothetical protein IHO40_01205 [Wolbachia endosymbiont of Mansonella ozzardi]|uniref:hypothetical protein n=1 Tax=Wolbachia endosymbiont of Mansonella ozzardi TaxID=137464 RepID=UPI001CE09D02|nr:hypothetical protein [Wolbachia endosymbiont of Mansonella ozzardi]MCA4774789.1 hypothetical protein [Wolbachia endosymbiont of Mansonella ozzardi]
MSGASFIHAKTKDGHRETADILDSITTEVAESESSSVRSSLEDHQEIQESDEEYFESERDKLEAAKKGTIEISQT